MKKKITPSSLDSTQSAHFFNSIIAPRPIAFVSTVNKNGLPNAAPYCSFMLVSSSPPILAISIFRRGDQKKDTLKNIEKSRDFVINLVDEKLAAAMNMAGGNYPTDMSEFDVAGLTPVSSEHVSAPRIHESPIQIECKLKSLVEFGDVPATLVLADVVCVHVKETLLQDFEVNTKKLALIGQIGEEEYVRTTGELIRLTRPA